MVSAGLVGAFSAAYKNAIGYVSSFFGDMSEHLLLNDRFSFASLVSPSGKIPREDFQKSGDTHAQVYWELTDSGTQGNWDHR